MGNMYSFLIIDMIVSKYLAEVQEGNVTYCLTENRRSLGGQEVSVLSSVHCRPLNYKNLCFICQRSLWLCLDIPSVCHMQL